MLGFGTCWLPASNRALLGPCSRRSFTVSSASFAKAAPSKDGKKKVNDLKDKVVKYSDAAESSLTQLDTFKKYQHHEMFSKPVSMVSDNTMNLENTFMSKLEQETKTNRMCLVGEKGVGKSLLVAQAPALALSK